jgi:hypothetical protein
MNNSLLNSECSTKFNYDIHEYIAKPFLKTTAGILLWWSGIILLALIVALAIYAFVGGIVEKRISPIEQVKKELGKLSKKECKNRNEFKLFYFELITVLKRFLSRRAGLKVIDKTDSETVEVFKKFIKKEVVAEKLEKLISGAQSVRFANELALAGQAKIDLELVRKIVLETESQVLNAEAEDKKKTPPK